MKLSISFALFATTLFCACSSQLSRPTSKEYADACRNFEHNGQFVPAESECYMALVNADWSKNPKVKSQTLYNLGRIKQKLGKFREAELLFKESLQIEERYSSPPLIIGNRLIALSVSFAGQNKWSEGAQLLERVLPIAPQYSRQERIHITQLLLQYSQQLKSIDQDNLARRFENTARILQ
jgi:tetratricopeptide (TPR) repeat protein